MAISFRKIATPRTKGFAMSWYSSWFENFQTIKARNWFDASLVKSRMLRTCHNFKVLNSIVQFIFIFMMNDFFSSQWPSEEIRHNQSMLKNVVIMARTAFSSIWMIWTKNLDILARFSTSTSPTISIRTKSSFEMLSCFSTFAHGLDYNNSAIRSRI